MLQGKKIILGITGGIAAYKCAQLVRLLVKEGAEVQVIMTPAAADFVTPKTLSVLSKRPALLDFFDNNNNWNNHVQLAEWADLLIIAPLTANTLAKMANGNCDNLLLATFLSATCPYFVAPAMDLDMYQHPTVRANLEKLSKNGAQIIPAETGELASGLSGEGRMAEPENILKFINAHIQKTLPLAGKKAFVNAGPTYEPIDPVRFIGNRSSGKMGIAIAETLAERGAQVVLVLGPSHESVSKNIEVIRVESSADMLKESERAFLNCDIAVCSAAVADFRPVQQSTEKIKKKDQKLELVLEQTTDIIALLGQKKTKQVLVGFALETENLLENAAEKMKRKNLDLIVANAASAAGGVFGNDQNKATLLFKDNKTLNFELKTKWALAQDIVNAITDLIKK